MNIVVGVNVNVTNTYTIFSCMHQNDMIDLDITRHMTC